MDINEPRLSENLEALLSGRQDISTILFSGYYPLLLERLTITKDGTISVKKNGRRRQQWSIAKDKNLQEQILKEQIYGYLIAGLPFFHAAQHYFDRYMVRESQNNNNKHVYKGDGAKKTYHEGVIEHLRTIRRTSETMYSRETSAALDKIIATERNLPSWRLEQDVYIVLRHGSLTLRAPRTPNILLTRSRIKTIQSIIEKVAFRMCDGIKAYNELVNFVKKRNGLRIDNCKAFVTLGDMFAHGFQTPIDEETQSFREANDYLNPIDFLFFHSRINDFFGVTYVTQTMEQAESFMQRLETGRFYNSDSHELAFGYRCDIRRRRDDRIDGRFVRAFLKENTINTRGKINSEGNLRIVAYIQPKQELPSKYRAEIAVTSLDNFCRDEIGGIGSHEMYVARKRTIIDRWKRTDRELFDLNKDIKYALAPLLPVQERVYGLPIHNNL